jgi:transposase
VLDKVRILRPGRGRPRRRPDVVLADKAYSAAATRAWCRAHHVRAVIPVKDDQAANRRKKGSAGGRPPTFDTVGYRARNCIERCINKLKQFRAVATRYDKRQHMYEATVTIAAIAIWLRDPVN